MSTVFGILTIHILQGKLYTFQKRREIRVFPKLPGRMSRSQSHKPWG